MGKVKYIDIKNSIKHEIFDGEYKNKQKLPNENKLIEKYHASKLTIKKAIDALVSEGLVFKKQGSGTYINTNYHDDLSINNNKVTLPTSLTYANIGNKVTSKILEFNVLKAPLFIQNLLNLKSDDFVYKCVRVRYVDGDPCSLDEVYYPINLISGLNIDILNGSIFHYIKDVLKLTPKSYHKFIYSEPPTALYQTELKLKKTEPLSVVEQVGYLDNGKPYEYGTVKYRYDKFKYKTIDFF